MDPLKMHFLLNMGIFHCYVSLPEGRFPKSRNDGISNHLSDVTGWLAESSHPEKWMNRTFGSTPPPRMPVTTRMTAHFSGESHPTVNLYLFAIITRWGEIQFNIYLFDPFSQYHPFLEFFCVTSQELFLPTNAFFPPPAVGAKFP